MLLVAPPVGALAPGACVYSVDRVGLISSPVENVLYQLVFSLVRAILVRDLSSDYL